MKKYWTPLTTMFNGTKDLVIMGCKLANLSLLEICFYQITALNVS